MEWVKCEKIDKFILEKEKKCDGQYYDGRHRATAIINGRKIGLVEIKENEEYITREKQ
jgi:hypothetical protein